MLTENDWRHMVSLKVQGPAKVCAWPGLVCLLEGLSAHESVASPAVVARDARSPMFPYHAWPSFRLHRTEMDDRKGRSVRSSGHGSSGCM